MLAFAKYSGAGNDFVVVLEDQLGDIDAGVLASRICPRSTGVGVDGLIVLARATGGVRARFFNPDGSEFGTCGNGSRSAALYARDEGLVDEDPFALDTPDAAIEASVSGNRVELLYSIDAAVEYETAVDGPEGEATGWFVRMGVPHFVLPVEAMPEGSIDEVCAPVRNDSRFGEEGANVNLVLLRGDGTARIRTFERGVEAETLACGSGCMAAALALYSAGRAARELDLIVHSGDRVRVTLPDDVAPGASRTGRLGLAGGARRCFQGSFPPPPYHD